ncbi:MAG: IclR family transcriptional regulator [Anaerolineae bacterium]|jgi:DNA-binding IclR family transcriptional regulator
MSDRATGDYNIRAVERAVRVLVSFSDDHPERTLPEIARATELPKSTAYRILATLNNCGFVEQTRDGERYRLGMRVASLGLVALQRLSIRRDALPHMEQLVGRFEETCVVGIFDQGAVLDIEVVHSDHLLTVTSEVGHRLPIHCTATGKALLAFLPHSVAELVLARSLEAYTEKTITSPADMRQEMALTRERGYAVDEEEYEVGVRAVAAPISDIHGRVIAGISIPGPTSRLTADRVPEIAQALMEVASAIRGKRRQGLC